MTFKFAHSNEGQPPLRIPAIGLELSVRLPPASTAGALTVIDTVNAPGFGPPLHRHRQTEIFRVLAGRYLFETDGQRFYAETGDVVTVPAGAVHAFVNVTDAPARQMVLIMPALDAEKFFTALGEIMRDGVPDRELLNAFGRRWEMEFLGAPLKAA